MSDLVTTPTESKSLEKRSTFTWPTRLPSSTSMDKPTQAIAPFTETKLPVKQRVVFPSDRFNSYPNGNNNNDNGQSNGKNNNQRYNHDYDDESWE